MNITTIASANDVQCDIIENKNVVIIDVLRATSVIVTALANKAKYIVPMESIEETQIYYDNFKSKDIVLCGEREAKMIDGFHFGNSPLAYTEENIGGKIIVHTTSNGTRAIKACHRGKNIYIASFLNIQAIVDKLTDDNLDTVIVCSGTNNHYSMDDAMCAGMIISQIEKKKKVILTDLAWTMKEIYDHNSNNVYDFLSKTCYHFNLLEKSDFKEDLNYCLQQNIYDIIPIYTGDYIKLLEVNK